MTEQISVERFTKELFECLDETFERHHGIFLDRGTSLSETLANVSAEEASRPVAEKCAPISAHVEHVRFYLDVLNDVLQKQAGAKVNWREIWENVREVTPEEWDAQKRRLDESYRRVLETIRNYGEWGGEYGVSESLGILAHTAYHLGAIRQAACAIKSAKS